MDSLKKILIITGPTATGKTDIALHIAKTLNGQLIAADSRQVYTGLDLGTGKYPNSYKTVQKKSGCWVIDDIPIFLYDVSDPTTPYNVSQFITDSKKLIAAMQREQVLPVIVGGTPFYIHALLHGLSQTSAPDPLFRAELESLTLQQLQERVQESDATRWNTLTPSDQKNRRRLIRALELLNTSSSTTVPGIVGQFDILTIGLTAPKEVLTNKVNNRVVSRLQQGMVEEAKNLHQYGLPYERMDALGLEYAVLAQFLQDKLSYEQMIYQLQMKIRQFVKRQLTWFKRMQGIEWFNITDQDFITNIEKRVRVWYHSS